MEISTKLLSQPAVEICRVLSQHGYQSFLVGGCIRDLLLNQSPKDWDITTDATPQQVMKLFPKTIPTGLQHGTVTVVVGEGIENHFEVTTFRIEGNYLDGRRPEEVFFVQNVEQDLARRDLTINAIAYDPITNYLVDPYRGREDLQNKIIRAVGSPKARFQEDGLRIMRAARFAARFGYSIEHETLKGMGDSIDTLKSVSRERIQDELCKTLMTRSPALGLQFLSQCGALKIALPYLTSSPELLHFPITRFYLCHGHLEARLALLFTNAELPQVQKEMISLKFATKQIKRVCFLLELLSKFKSFVAKDNALAYKSFMSVVKNHAPDPWTYTLEQFILFSEALLFGSRALLEKYQEEVVFSKQEMAINGHDLLEIGLPPGPQLKTILDDCYLEILRNPEHNQKQFLLEIAATRFS